MATLPVLIVWYDTLYLYQSSLSYSHTATFHGSFGHVCEVAPMCSVLRHLVMVPIGLTRVCHPDGISIGLAILQGSPMCTTHTDQGTCNVCSGRLNLYDAAL